MTLLLQRLGISKHIPAVRAVHSCFWSLCVRDRRRVVPRSDLRAERRRNDGAARLDAKTAPQAAISYSSVTLTFFSTIYATLTFGYDPSPFILEIVSHAAMAGLDLKPWMTDIGALDAKGAPTDKLRHGSTFVTTMLVTKLFVPVKLPLAAALTPAVSRALRRYGVLWEGAMTRLVYLF